MPLKQGRGKQLVRGWSQVIEGDGRGTGGLEPHCLEEGGVDGG